MPAEMIHPERTRAYRAALLFPLSAESSTICLRRPVLAGKPYIPVDRGRASHTRDSGTKRENQGLVTW